MIQWIPIEERQPDYDKEVLVRIQGKGEVLYAVASLERPVQGAPKGYVKWWPGEAISAQEAELRSENITAWMELPE